MMPVHPYQQESNIIKDYALVLIFVSIVATLWIIFNEVVMKLGNVTLNMVSGTAADLVYFIILIYRITPIGMVLGVFIWCFLRAVRKEPYTQFVR